MTPTTTAKGPVTLFRMQLIPTVDCITPNRVDPVAKRRDCSPTYVDNDVYSLERDMVSDLVRRQGFEPRTR